MTILLFFLMFFLLLYHNDVISGAQQGLLLWYQILIPSLLPFIIVTNALSETNSYYHLVKKLRHYFPYHASEFVIFILGNLCGYPIGGKILDQFIAGSLISPKKKDYLLPYVSQASPMFILGYIYSHILEEKVCLPVFLISVYLPPCIGFFFLSKKEILKNSIGSSEKKCKINVTDTFYQATKTIVLIGIYVMIFSIAYEIILPLCHIHCFRFLLSFLEITTGLNILKNTYENSIYFLPMVGMLTTFGGFCSIFQIQCVIHFKIKKYLQTKLLLSAGTFFILLLYEIFKIYYP